MESINFSEIYIRRYKYPEVWWRRVPEHEALVGFNLDVLRILTKTLQYAEGKFRFIEI